MTGLGTFAAIVGIAGSLPPLLTQSGVWQFGGAGALASTAPLVLWFGSFAISMTRVRAGDVARDPLIASA